MQRTIQSELQANPELKIQIRADANPVPLDRASLRPCSEVSAYSIIYSTYQVRKSRVPGDSTGHPRAQLQIAPSRRGLPTSFTPGSASLARQEADLSFQLPGSLIQSTPLDIPDEPIIVIAADGQVSVNDYPYDTPDAAALPELSHMLKRYQHSCPGNQVTASVTLAPAAAGRQQRSRNSISR